MTNTLIPNKTLALYANYNCDTIVNGKKLGGLNAQQEYRSQPQETGSAVQVSVILQTDTSGILYIDYTNIVHEPYDVIEYIPIDFIDKTVYTPLPLINGQNFYTHYAASTVKSPYFRVRFKNTGKCKQKVFRITTFLFQTVTEFKTNIVIPTPEPPTPPPPPPQPVTTTQFCDTSTNPLANNGTFRSGTRWSNGTPTVYDTPDPNVKCGWIQPNITIGSWCTSGISSPKAVPTTNTNYYNAPSTYTATGTVGSYTWPLYFVTSTYTGTNAADAVVAAIGSDTSIFKKYIFRTNGNTRIIGGTLYADVTITGGNPKDPSCGYGAGYPQSRCNGTTLETTTLTPPEYNVTNGNPVTTTTTVQNSTRCGYVPPLTCNFFISTDNRTLYSQAIPVTPNSEVTITLNTASPGKTSGMATILNICGVNSASPPAYNSTSWRTIKNQTILYQITLSSANPYKSVNIPASQLIGIKFLRIIGQYKQQTTESAPATIFYPAQIDITNISTNDVTTYSSTLTPTSTLSDSG